ncbi:MAG: InlB B-repeat-containing protein [Candidatus Aphodomorpha sp.]
MKKRFLGILLSLCMALLLFPATALADDTSELRDLLNNPAIDKIVLERDYTISSTLYVSDPVTLDLNGHVIKMTGSDSVFNIPITGELTLQDSAPEATHTGEYASLPAGGVITRTEIGSGNGININGGQLTMTGGTIYGFHTNGNGGGVSVEYGSFTMNGGAIKDCFADGSGGGVFVEVGSFTMTGGVIKDCYASSNGGGVSVEYGSFTMNGGAIKDCFADGSGGGVFVEVGSFTMTGGVIKDCYASSGGGGVDVYSGSFTMTGGTIEDCSATGGGSAVFTGVNTTIFANGGEIKGTVWSFGQIRNTATDGGCTRFYGEVRNSSNSLGSGTISGGVYYGGIRDDGGKVEDTYHTVRFQLNGGSGSAPTQWFVNIDTAPALRPADPTKGDLTFTGWYTDAALTKLYNFDSAVTENLTLYAGFERQYTVTYEFEHGTLADDRETPETVADGTVITLPDLENCGAYRLVGWQIKNSDDIDVYPVGEEYAVCDSMTFVAVYEEVPQLTVTYEFAHGSLADGRKTPETVGEDTTITLPDLKDCGAYKLTGWRVKSSDDTAIYSPGDKYVPKKNVTFVAVYESNTTPNPGDGEIVETGDSRTTGLWIALLLVSVCGLFGTAVFARKSRAD